MAQKILLSLGAPHKSPKRISYSPPKRVSLRDQYNFSSSILKDEDEKENGDYFSENESSVEVDEIELMGKRKGNALGPGSLLMRESFWQRKCEGIREQEGVKERIKINSILLQNDMKTKEKLNSGLFMAINKQRIREIELQNGLKRGSHGHTHQKEQESNQSFCVKIFNKSLNRMVKNRHMNNHDVKRIVQEAEQNMMKMQKVIEDQILSKTLSYRICFKNANFLKSKREMNWDFSSNQTNDSPEILEEPEIADKSEGFLQFKANEFKIRKQLKMNNYQFLLSTRPNSAKPHQPNQKKNSALISQDPLGINLHKRISTEEKQNSARSNATSLGQTKSSFTKVFNLKNLKIRKKKSFL
jgi:hypothetical protein